jgi:predicted  nucleic acid-binding Zn-ribbon protein
MEYWNDTLREAEQIGAEFRAMDEKIPELEIAKASLEHLLAALKGKHAALKERFESLVEKASTCQAHPQEACILGAKYRAMMVKIAELEGNNATLKAEIIALNNTNAVMETKIGELKVYEV